MKNIKVFWGLMMLSASMASFAQNQDIQLYGTVRNLQGKPIVYYQSIGGMFNSQSYDTLHINPDSTYTLTLPAEPYKRIRFVLWGKKQLGTVLTNKRHIQVNLDGFAEQSIEYKGDNPKEKEILVLLDRLNTDVWDLCARRGDRWKIAQDTLASSVLVKLKADALAMDEKMKGVDEELYKKLKQDVRMQLMLAFQNRLMGVVRNCSKKNKQQWLEAWEQMRSFCSDNTPTSPFSLAFYDVVFNNVAILYAIKGEKPATIADRDRVGMSFHYYEQELSGKAQEAAMAQLFLQDEVQENYNPALIKLSEQFKMLYPKSVWTSLVDKAVAKNRAFNEVKMPDGIYFPDIQKVKTFREVIDRYKGKIVFLDIWATWCGPCRESFAFAKSLQEYVTQRDDVVLLYLSVDRPKDDAKWRKMIALYDLKGEHVRVQKTFYKEVYQTVSDQHGTLTIPRCVIFDKNGKIAFHVAASPEDIEKLKLQIEQAAKN